MLSFFDLIKSRNYGHKYIETVPDDIELAENSKRIFRDLSTDIFNNVFFKDNNLLVYFIDYTYHKIYSSLILNLNKNLINYSNNNRNVNLKPINGNEDIILIFKGGTLMNRAFENFFWQFNKLPLQQISSKEIKTEFNIK